MAEFNFVHCSTPLFAALIDVSDTEWRCQKSKVDDWVEHFAALIDVSDTEWRITAKGLCHC